MFLFYVCRLGLLCLECEEVVGLHVVCFVFCVFVGVYIYVFGLVVHLVFGLSCCVGVGRVVFCCAFLFQFCVLLCCAWFVFCVLMLALRCFCLRVCVALVVLLLFVCCLMFLVCVC